MLIDFDALSFLSISIVIYFHSQVVDGQRKIISLLQEQIENVRRPYLCVAISSVHLMAPMKRLSLMNPLYLLPFPCCSQEGEDKKFLITRLQSIHEQKRTPTRRLTSQVCVCRCL